MWSLNKLINALFRTVLRYLFVHLLLKAIAAGQQISQKIEQLFLLDFCFLLVVSYCFCNNMVKNPRLYFCILKVVLFHLYHLC